MQCICAGYYKGSEDILAGLSSLSDKAHGSGSVQNKQNSRSINLYSDHCNRLFYFELHAVLSSADILNLGTFCWRLLFQRQAVVCLFHNGWKRKEWERFVLP